MKTILFKIGKFFDKYLKLHSCIELKDYDCGGYGMCKYCGSICVRASKGKWVEI